MHRIAPLLAAAFALFLLPAAPGRAESADATLDGTWMAMGDVLGLVPDNVEVLAIAGHAAEAALWRMGAEGPVSTARGALAFGAMDLAFSGEAGNNPFAGSEAAARWPLVALEGGPWVMLRQGEQMILTRNAPIGGQEVPVLRIWLRVAPEVPARIVAWLGAAQLRASRALCPLATLHADPARWEAFTQALAAGQGAPAPGAGEALLAGLGWPAPLEQVAAAARCTQRVFGE